MRRVVVLVAALLALGASPALADEFNVVDVADLVNDGHANQGPVVVVGELIGDFGFRNDGSMWSQLNGDSYALDPVLDGGVLTGGNIGVAVRIPQALAVGLDAPGGYRVRGPIVEVQGAWRYHDENRGGESYLDVTSLEVVESGHGLPEHPNYWIMGAGIALVAAAFVLRRPHRQVHR